MKQSHWVILDSVSNFVEGQSSLRTSIAWINFRYCILFMDSTSLLDWKMFGSVEALLRAISLDLCHGYYSYTVDKAIANQYAEIIDHPAI